MGGKRAWTVFLLGTSGLVVTPPADALRLADALVRARAASPALRAAAADLDREATETVFDLLADRISVQYFFHIAIVVPAEAALGKKVRPWARPALQSARHDFFRVPQTVDCGSVNPVDTEF